MIRRAGGGLDTVARVLGHSNLQTSARYAHVEVEDTRAFLVAASFAQPLPTGSAERRPIAEFARILPARPRPTAIKPKQNKAARR